MKTNYAYFPIYVNDKEFGATRNEIYDYLKTKNIFTRKYFYPLTNTFECYGDRFDVADTPVALKVSKRILTLPLYADLAIEDVDRICDLIIECKKD